MSDALVRAARAVQQHAYAPYSGFRVGAALEAEDGSVHIGCNVENASYGLSICAERAAVSAAVSAGARRFRRAVIVSDSEPPAAPCGACRQVMAEFGNYEITAVGAERTLRWRVGELLPAAFAPELLA